MNIDIQYIKVLTASIVGVIFVYVFYVIYLNVSLGAKVEEVDRLKSIWSNRKNMNYSYTVRKSCMFSNSYHVVHRNGKTTYIDIDDELSGAQKIDMLGIFDLAKKAISEAYQYSIKYSSFGYPELIDVNWKLETYDDECSIQVSDFRQI